MNSTINPKAEGLTDAEKKEQQLLRQEYIASVRENLRGQLNNISIQEKDGSVTDLGKKYGRKKRKIRKRILGLREEMDCLNWREKTAAIFHKVTAHPWFQEANTIYCYVDFRNEVGTADLMEKAWEMGKSVAVPKTDGERMDFLLYPFSAGDGSGKFRCQGAGSEEVLDGGWKRGAFDPAGQCL